MTNTDAVGVRRVAVTGGGLHTSSSQLILTRVWSLVTTETTQRVPQTVLTLS